MVDGAAPNRSMDRTQDSAFEIGSLARIDLNLLVPLYLMLEERSVTRAAARMGLSQPAMSHALARCRKVLDDELLFRVGTRLQPTDRGRTLLEPLRRLLGEVNHDVFDRPIFDPATSTRRFHIAATSSTALVLLPGLLAGFATVAPRVSIHLLPPLKNGDEILGMPEIDAAIVADRVSSTLRRERLYDDRWVVAASPNNPHIGDIMSLETLSEIPHVAYEVEGSLIAPYVTLEEMGVRVDVQVRSHDFAIIPSLVSRTHSLAIVQSRLAHVFEGTGLIRTWPLPVDVPALGMDLIVNPRFRHDPATLWLRSQLKRAIPELGGA